MGKRHSVAGAAGGAGRCGPSPAPSAPAQTGERSVQSRTSYNFFRVAGETGPAASASEALVLGRTAAASRARNE
ncbi:hypothetical protein EVAR_40934_1 [Eumeta japonica]|uniref:Uncharacterized protein n=1 Tax=Eumeta variegata TaxID=151549 RepID=A0A4C1X7Y6_EUMVA|nr:hypothetical protein EVAR_40934_1 [Eumeta japonica]